MDIKKWYEEKGKTYVKVAGGMIVGGAIVFGVYKIRYRSIDRLMLVTPEVRDLATAVGETIKSNVYGLAASASDLMRLAEDAKATSFDDTGWIGFKVKMLVKRGG